VAVTLRHEAMTIHACVCLLRRIRCVGWDEGDSPNVGLIAPPNGWAFSRPCRDDAGPGWTLLVLSEGVPADSFKLKPDTAHLASGFVCGLLDPGMQRDCGVQLGR
jgi:hypothetical protein